MSRFRVMLCESIITVEAETEDSAKEIAAQKFRDELRADDLIAWEETAGKPE